MSEITTVGESKRLLCPLLKDYCLESKCAWYGGAESSNWCAILDIAFRLEDIRDNQTRND
jgi:hypothetical protein